MFRLFVQIFDIAFITVVLIGSATIGYERLLVKRLREEVVRQSIDLVPESAKSGIPLSLYNSLGWYGTDRRSAPLKYMQRKSPGVIRIGAFGDSWTFGDEVSVGLDFPSQLEGLFRTRGSPNVEVLNFGGSGFGFHQEFKLWDEFAKTFQLDFIIIGPVCFQIERDNTLWSGQESYPAAIHGRYYLEENNLKFIDAPWGLNLVDRFDRFFGFLSGFKYLRYDRTRPYFVHFISKKEKPLDNPFYYTQLDDVDEQNLIEKKMYETLLHTYGQVVTLNIDPRVVGFTSELQGASVSQSYSPQFRFPFWRKAHPSAAGYQNLAEAYYDMLTGREKIQQLLFEFKAATPVANTARLTNLDNFRNGSVYMDNQKAGDLVYADNFKTTDDPDKLVDFNDGNISALIGVSNQFGSFSDSVFFPLKESEFIKSGGLQLIRETNGLKTSFPLEPPRLLSSNVGILHFSLPGIFRERRTETNSDEIYWKTDEFDKFLQSNLKIFRNRGDIWTIRFGSKNIIDIVNDLNGTLLLKPSDGKKIIFRSAKYDALDVQKLPLNGTLNLKFNNTVSSIATWKKTLQWTEYPKDRLKRIIDHGKIVTR